MSTLATYVINFDTEKQGNEGYLYIEIDPDKNNGKMSFSPGDPITLSIMSSSIIKETWTSAGNLSASGNSTKTITEYFAIDNKYSETTEVSLRYDPLSIKERKWLGQQNGNVTFDGRRILLPSGSYFGYYKVTYTYNVYYYNLTSISSDYSETNVCVFFVNDEEVVINQIITLMTDDEEDEDNPEVSIIVKDYVAETVVPGTVVQVDGETVGVTDDNGYCYIGKLTRGRHDLKLIPPSPYLQSDQDGLANDWFTID